MAPAVPAFKDLGKVAKGVLYGGSTLNGNKGYDQVVNVSTTAVDGVSFVATVVKKADVVEPSIKATWRNKQYTAVGTVFPSGKVAATATWANVAPGLNLAVTGTLPNIDTAKLALDYTVPHLTLKTALASFTGAEKKPVLEVSATTGYKDFTFGLDGGFSFDKQAVTGWTLAGGYVARDFVVSTHLTDTNVLGATYAHIVTPGFSAAGEVLKDLDSGETTISVGVSKALRGGASAKARVDSKGIASLLYETDLQAGTKLAITSQYNVISQEAAPKVGFALDVKGP